jgi:hypothetical protein
MLHTILFLLAKFVQTSVFGQLSTEERKVSAGINFFFVVHDLNHPRQACKEDTFNFVLFRVVFMAAIVDVDDLVRELLVWTTWFFMIGAMRVFLVLSRERFPSVCFIDYAVLLLRILPMNQ